MILSTDPTTAFIPKGGRPKLIILGTMVSYSARATHYCSPEEAFYYHDGRNRFWGVMTDVFEGEVRKLNSKQEKMDFLHCHNVAIANLVESIKITPEEDRNASDDILFKAFQDKRLKFKNVDEKFKSLLEKTPTFFTCKKKPMITKLLNAYFEQNKVTKTADDIIFLRSPTRQSYKNISDQWRKPIMNIIKE